MYTYYDIYGKKTSVKESVAKESSGKSPKYYIKRSSLGFFFNASNIYHEKAIKADRLDSYEFKLVKKGVFDLYMGFLLFRSEAKYRMCERLYRE